MERATLNEIRHAVEAAFAYYEIGAVDVAAAVETTCDYQGIVRDDDRRVVRRAVAKRVSESQQLTKRSLRA